MMSKKSFQMSSKAGSEPRRRILAIDPGFGRLGYAVLEETGGLQKLIEADCIETSSQSPYKDRFLKIANKLKKIIKKCRPQKLAIEKIFFTQNKKTALQIAEIKGLVLYLAFQNNLQVFEFTPLEIKMAICGYGKADKIQVSRMVKAILKLTSLPKSDDVTDAIAIGLACFNKGSYPHL